MTRYSPSDHQCLRAVQRALAAHCATRPATTGECSEIAARHRCEAEALIASAEALENLRSPTAAERGRGPQAIDAQHAGSRAVCRALQDAGRLRQAALCPQMRAEAWERIADQPGAAWLATEATYLGRVAYYQGLIDARAEVSR